MIGIINYGLGNIKAFANIFKLLNVPFRIVFSVDELSSVSKIILPGVGAFDPAMKLFQASGMRECVEELVLVKKLPVIGVCVGMQMLTHSSEEGVLQGLGWIDGNTKKINPIFSDTLVSIPHMGWNNIKLLKENPLFKNLDSDSRFYFLHSYYVSCNKSEDVLAVTTHGGEFPCAVNHENIYGVQFHPEKSHHDGIQLLKNFAEL